MTATTEQSCPIGSLWGRIFLFLLIPGLALLSELLKGPV